MSVSRRSGYNANIGNRRCGGDTSIATRGVGTTPASVTRGHRRSTSTNYEGTCSSFVFLEVQVGERFLVCFQELGGPCVREGEGYKYWAPVLSEPNGNIVEDRSLLVRIC